MIRDNTFKIYKITNSINDKIYIGLTTQTIEQRWSVHINKNSSCRVLNRAFRKYGKDNLIMEHIFTAFDVQSMVEMEKFFIKYYNCLAPNGYNLMTGGQYSKASEETKAILRIKNKENWTDNLKNKQSITFKQKWKNEPKMQDRLKGLRSETKKRKQSIIGINVKDFSIKKFESINEAERFQKGISQAIENNSYAGQYIWFKNTEELNYYLDKSKKLLNNPDFLNRGKQSWNKCNSNARLTKLANTTKNRQIPIVSVSIETKEVKYYKSVNIAIRSGFSANSINECLKERAIRGMGHCWFYKTEENKSFYQIKAANLLSNLRIGCKAKIS